VNNRRLLVGIAVLSAILILVAVSASASIPKKINYQGRLTDSGTGLPMPGSYSGEFRIYDDPSVGALLWSETNPVVADTNGVFNVILGSVTPIDISFDGPAYLEVVIDGELLSPRREIVSSAYSFHALNADSLGGLPAEEYATGDLLGGTGSINDPSNPVDWTQLKNVPAGFADGTDDEGGSGDGHSLDAADGVPEDVVYVDNDGLVGVGTTSPQEKLHVSGDVRIDADHDIAFGGDATRIYNSTDDLYITADDDLLLKPDSDVYIGEDGSSAWVRFYSGMERVGIGTTDPQREIHLHRDGSVTNYFQITNTPTGSGQSDGVKLGLNGSGHAFLYQQENLGLSFGTDNARRVYISGDGDVEIGGGTSPEQRLDVDGNIVADSVFIGTGSVDGGLEIEMAGASNPVLEAGPVMGYGSKIWLRDEEGNRTLTLEPDYDGSGGYFAIGRNTSANGLSVNGNYLSSGNPLVAISGASRSAVFNMNNSGDASVDLPADAVSAGEILDEPGVASATYNGPYIYLDSDWTALASRTIVNPGADYCLVIGTAEAHISHTNGTLSFATFGVSTVINAIGDNQDMTLSLSGNVPSGTFYFPVTVHGLFEAYHGSDSFYFLANESSGNFSVYDVQLTVIYFSTAYGTVQPTVASESWNIEDQTGERLPPTEADLAVEQAESETFYRAAVERDLAEIRARVEALEREMEGQQQ
jgi:hypothetical protein